MPEEFDYFAYGSNMLTGRLVQWTPSARVISVGHIEGYQLIFDRVSGDVSGKCSDKATGNADDFAYGVVYRISVSEKPPRSTSQPLGTGEKPDFSDQT
jgi:hypothetical protein